MLHAIFIGILLGWGAAIPIGPMNIEVIRRNLSFGTLSGTLCGLGACLADLSYLILVAVGALTLLQNPKILDVMAIGGSAVLIYFAIGAFRMKADKEAIQRSNKPTPAWWRNTTAGYLMTLLNPYTVLFWVSVSSQVAALTAHGKLSVYDVGLGILFGTFSWVATLNIILHFTRHRLPSTAMRYLNIAGGTILLGFAMFGILHVL